MNCGHCDPGTCMERLASLAEPIICVEDDKARAIHEAATAVARFLQADRYVSLPFKYAVERLLALLEDQWLYRPEEADDRA